MNIYMALSLFSLIILLYWVITELFTILFRFTGLPDERARFQVISLLTGCGFTTKESELILSNRRRRRLARITMLFGYVFNITIVSALVNVFLSLKLTQIGHYYLGLLIPLAAGALYPLLGWKMHPDLGALAMSLSSFCVCANALRLNRFDPAPARPRRQTSDRIPSP